VLAIFCYSCWIRDIYAESFRGFHREVVQRGLKGGFTLFIISEIMFFFAFFWAFFHRRVSPRVELGISWPPEGVLIFDHTRVPLFNTVILLSRGFRVTYAHVEYPQSYKNIRCSILVDKRGNPSGPSDAIFWISFKEYILPSNSLYLKEFSKDEYTYYVVPKPSRLQLAWSLENKMIKRKISTSNLDATGGFLLTIMLGVLFTLYQIVEYIEAYFTIKDGAFGRTFFIATGFHGLHVLVGTIFLLNSLLIIFNGGFSPLRHTWIIIAIWYWHFVDVVWLFLFVCIYWWGAK